MSETSDANPPSLILFVYGTSPRSLAAITNAQKVAEQVGASTHLKIIDAQQQPELLEHHDILALPTLLRDSPTPVIQFVGDLSDLNAVRAALHDS